MRRMLLLVAALLTGLVAVPGQAAPDAGERRVAYADLRYTGTDGLRYEASFQADVTGATPSLFVMVTACGKGYACDYDFVEHALAPGELTVATDGSAAALHTKIGATKVDITWVGGPGSPTTGLSLGVGGSLSVMTDHHPAVAHVKVADLSCPDKRASIVLGYGAVGLPTSVSLGDSPPARPAGLPGLAGAVCTPATAKKG